MLIHIGFCFITCPIINMFNYISSPGNMGGHISVNSWPRVVDTPTICFSKWDNAHQSSHSKPGSNQSPTTVSLTRVLAAALVWFQVCSMSTNLVSSYFPVFRRFAWCWVNNLEDRMSNLKLSVFLFRWDLRAIIIYLPLNLQSVEYQP